MDWKPRTNLPQFRYPRPTEATIAFSQEVSVEAIPLTTESSVIPVVTELSVLVVPVQDEVALPNLMASSQAAAHSIGVKVQEFGEQVQSVSTALVGRSQELAITGATWAAENPSVVIYTFLFHCIMTIVTFAIVMFVGWYYRKVIDSLKQ